MDKFLYQRAKDEIEARNEKKRADIQVEKDIERRETERWQRYATAIKQAERRINDEEKTIKPFYKEIIKLLREIKDFGQQNYIYPRPDKSIGNSSSFSFDIVDFGFQFVPYELPSSSRKAFEEQINRVYYSSYSSEYESHEKFRMARTEKILEEIQSIHPSITLIMRWGFSKREESSGGWDSDSYTRVYISLCGIKVEINHQGMIVINGQPFSVKSNWRNLIRTTLSDAFYSPLFLEENEENYIGRTPETQKRPLWHRIWYGNETN